MKTPIVMSGIVAVALMVLAVGPARAQTVPGSPRPLTPLTPLTFDARWTPWLGCWRLVQENTREEGGLMDGAIAPAPVGPALTVCVQPSQTTSGITMSTFADGRLILEQTIAGDGVGHPVTESGCTGTQTSDWSRDGLRLFTRVQIACNGRPPQTISGLTLLTKGPAWVDIQAVNADGDEQVRIRRLERTTDQPAAIAALPADVAARAMMDAQAASVRPMSLQDVTEASAKIASQALEAAIVETQSRFSLDSRSLKQLANAKVPANVIDLMVAQSFPSHFRVERPMTLPPRPVTASAGGTTVVVGSAQYPYPYYDPFDPYYYYSYYYSPFAYPYYWGNSYYRGPNYYISNGNTTVIVPNGSSGTAVGGGSSSDGGQVINGRGYTRVHSGSATDTSSDPAQHTATTTPRTGRSTNGNTSSSSSDSSSGSSSSSGSDSSGGASSSGGYSSGGSGDTGRTAQPR